MSLGIHATKLTRRYGSYTAVNSIDLRVRAGALHGFLGLNGAGKSTTIRMLCGLLPPTAGTASVAGHDIVQETMAVRRNVGLVADLDAREACPSWTGREYLLYFARLWRSPDPEARVDALLDQLGLEVAWRRRLLGHYSTGMRRRMEVARAMLGNPRVLFLDEPTRGLDLPAKRETWAWLRDVAIERGMTIFLSSHEVREIRSLCDEITVIAKGGIVHRGPTSALGASDVDAEQELVRLLESDARHAIASSPCEG